MKSTSSLETYFNELNIRLAYYRVKCWPDRMAKDLFGINAFGYQLEKNCSDLSNKLLAGRYSPQNGFKYYLPKASKTQRTRTTLLVEDAIVYQAIGNVFAQKSYAKLYENENFVFGSVLSPETKQGVALLDSKDPNYFFFKFWKGLYKKFRESVINAITVDKVQYKFETDITGFFDSIPHYNLLLTLSKEFAIEDEILDFLQICLNKWSGTKENQTPGVGIPQGPLPSFLLANLLLYPLDNQLVGDGYKYYRYMDDIKIYGYEENELLKVLLTIDNYTKSYGLSINSKKTSIEKINPDVEDTTISELKKIELFDYYEIDEESFSVEDLSSKDVEKEIVRLSEQGEPDEIIITSNIINTITDPEKIIEYWKNSIVEVENELPGYYQLDGKILDIKPDIQVDDIDFIRLSSKFGSAHLALKELGVSIKPNEKLLEYWIFVYKKYFWRANNFGLTLMLYKNDESLKDSLVNFYIANQKLYEWVRYQIISVLSVSQSFSDRELRNTFYKFLQDEDSVLVRLALYRFLFTYASNPQLIDTVRKELKKEKSEYLKLHVLEFLKNKGLLKDNLVEFINMIGL